MNRTAVVEPTGPRSEEISAWRALYMDGQLAPAGAPELLPVMPIHFSELEQRSPDGD